MDRTNYYGPLHGISRTAQSEHICPMGFFRDSATNIGDLDSMSGMTVDDSAERVRSCHQHRVPSIVAKRGITDAPSRARLGK
eukprot:scaffold444757_cov20-Prasinocladus_malaysianus.AAC.1